jgi:hypothetical protein
MKVTLTRVSPTYYRVATESQPLIVQLGPVEISSMSMRDTNELRRTVLEVCNENAASATYASLVGIDTTLQTALAADEKKAGRRGALFPMFRAPTYIPAGPRLTGQILPTTVCYAERERTRVPPKCSIDDLREGSRIKVILDIVGLRRSPDADEYVWTYDVAITQILLLLANETEPIPTPCSLLSNTNPDARSDANAAKMTTREYDAEADERKSAVPDPDPFQDTETVADPESEWEVPNVLPRDATPSLF